MAYFLDISLMERFTSLFIFLLVLVGSYALMDKTGLLGKDKKGLHAIIAFLLAVLVSLSGKIIAIFKTLIPVILVIFLFFIIILALYQVMGVKGEEIGDMVKGSKEIQWILIIVILVAIIGVVFSVLNKTTAIDEYGNPYKKNYSDLNDKYNESELDVNYETGLFNPKLIGLVLVFLIGVFAIRLLAGDNTSNNKE